MKKTALIILLLIMLVSLVFADSHVSVNSSQIVSAVKKNDLYSFTHLIKQDPSGSLIISSNGNEYNIYKYVIDYGTVDMMKVLMDEKVDYNTIFTYYKEEYSPLEYALEKSKSDIVAQLLTAKDIVKESSNNKMLRAAVSSGSVELLEILKLAGVSINSKFESGNTYYTALSYALSNNEIKILDWLLTQPDIDVDCIGSSKPALYYAINKDDERMVAKLMALGAKPGRTFEYSNTIYNCLSYAIYNKKSFNIINNMIIVGDEDSLAAVECKKSPLCYAVENNDLTVTQALINAGANPNTTFTYYSSTHNALTYAISLKCRETVIEALLQSSTLDKNYKGCSVSPFYYALYNKNPAVLELLVRYDCNPNKTFTSYSTKYTPLSYAIATTVDNSTLDILLSSSSIDVNGRGSDYPPIYYALYYKNYYALEKLIEKGCNVNKTFKSWGNVYTPLGYTSDSKMKDMLQSANASPVPLQSKVEFQAAVDSKDIEKLKSALNATDDLNEIFEVDSKEYSLLSYACYVNADIEMINIILAQSGIDPECEDCPVSPIGYALINGNTATVQALINAGVNPNLKYKYNGSEEVPLRYAVQNKKKALIEVLLACNNIDLYQETVSSNAIKSILDQENMEYLNMFIAAGFDVNKLISDTETVLTYAIQGCSNFFIKMILDIENIDVNSKNASTHPVILAIRQNNLSILRLLIEKGANPNAQTTYYSSSVNAISYAILRETRMSLINTLLEAPDSDINASSLDYPCVIAALSVGDLEALTALLEKGADPNVKTSYYGNLITALEYSVINKGRVSLTNAIINSPAFDRSNQDAIASSYKYAIKNNDIELVALLVDSGLTTTSKITYYNDRFTPLEYAVNIGADTEIILILQNQ